MNTRMRFAFLVGMASLLYMAAGTAAAQTCSATTCPIGPNSNSRGQIGNGLPLPITARNPIEVPGLLTPNGVNQAGIVIDAGDRVVPTAAAFVIQQSPSPGTPTNNPRSLMFPPGQFRSPGPVVGIPVFLFNSAVFQVNTHLIISNPRTGSPSPTAAAGGRTGPATLTWCPGTPVTPIATANTNPMCIGPATSGGGGSTLYNGLARYTATKNQFGGPATGRTTGQFGGPVCTAGGCGPLFAGQPTRLPGTANATVYHNVNGLPGTQLPCNQANPQCQVAISVPVPITNGVFGGPLGKSVTNPQGLTLSAVRAATIGAGGTVLGIGPVIPTGGPFGNGAWPQQGVTSLGLPGTTGMLTISVTGQQGPVPEIFYRSGFDGRNAAGSGLLSIVGGALSNRTFSGPNANRSWITYWLPEPGAIVAGASALMMLGGCHYLVRRRRQD